MKHIHLDPAEPRCRNRARACDHAHRCARNRAPVPAQNATIGDYSLSIIPMPYIGGWCSMFKATDIDRVVVPIKPAVKPAIRGIA